jgi:hypothetical protein
MAAPVARVGCLDQGFEDIERSRLEAVAEQELLRARKPLDGRHQPQDELLVRLKGRSGAPRDIGHGGSIG